jgi:hypothetical protein
VEKPFLQWCVEIQDAYVRLGHTMGWQFLTSPQATLSRDCQIALITLNPGGSIERPDHGRESSETGSAYIVEAWKRGYAPGEAPLQIQVRRMFSLLAAAQGGRTTGDALLHASLAGYFVPFRSPQFKALGQPRESLAFAARLWTQILDLIDPKLIITIDQHTTRSLTRILNVKFGGTPARQQFPIGWGHYTADLFTYDAVAMLRLPHLSRFPIFGREASQPHVERIIEAVTPYLADEASQNMVKQPELI